MNRHNHLMNENCWQHAVSGTLHSVIGWRNLLRPFSGSANVNWSFGPASDETGPQTKKKWNRFRQFVWWFRLFLYQYSYSVVIEGSHENKNLIDNIWSGPERSELIGDPARREGSRGFLFCSLEYLRKHWQPKTITDNVSFFNDTFWSKQFALLYVFSWYGLFSY